jgi:saccharopine dehydrogenase-like NADP-dependent oxidoreductase
MSHVIVVIGAGLIGQAIARRVSLGKRVLLADLRQENAAIAADVLSNAGFEVRTASDFLVDGGVTASYWYGELAPKPS